MNAKQTLKKLQSLGSAQTRKTWGRHGVTGDMYGVKYADLGKLVKEIKVDHGLALELWESGNHDARTLATMIADPEKLTTKTLTAWIKTLDNQPLCAALAGVAAKSPAGPKLMPKWMAAKGEWPCATAWAMLSSLASVPDALTVAECRKHLKTIEKNIHAGKNWVKYSMNNALISMGTYVKGLEAEAIEVADRIGQVQVDHGLTDCKTPLAAPYIKKAAAHQRAKRKKAAAKKKSARTAAKKTAARKPAAKKPTKKKNAARSAAAR